jgi:hypothetical protein
LEVAREAKYRELRELELDYGTGKLSPEDYEATGAALRAEALAILDRIEAFTAATSTAEAGVGGAGVGGARTAGAGNESVRGSDGDSLGGGDTPRDADVPTPVG